jgi:hypothetical protein
VSIKRFEIVESANKKRRRRTKRELGAGYRYKKNNSNYPLSRTLYTSINLRVSGIKVVDL